MSDLLSRLIDNMIGRVDGPMHIRLLLQPLMATFFAIKSGMKDAKAGDPPYFWALFTNPDHRRAMLRNGWKSISNTFIMAIVMDIIYQLIKLHTIYPVEALLVAIILAIIPYLLLRGPANLFLRHFVTPKPPVTSAEHSSAIQTEVVGKH